MTTYTADKIQSEIARDACAYGLCQDTSLEAVRACEAARKANDVAEMYTFALDGAEGAL